jgi:hypothetical protein
MIQPGTLRSLGSLDPFSDKDLDLLLAVSKARSIASGSVLYAQGERARSCFLLVQGLLQVERARASGAQVIATLHPGTFVGQIALMDNGKRTATVRAPVACVPGPARDRRHPAVSASHGFDRRHPTASSIRRRGANSGLGPSAGLPDRHGGLARCAGCHRGRPRRRGAAGTSPLRTQPQIFARRFTTETPPVSSGRSALDHCC